MTSSTPLTQRVPSLDGLRGFSIILVILGHVAGTAGLPTMTGYFHQLGNWGVKFFFVISGLIITRLLILELENDGIDFKRFWLRRVARILPAYFFYVLAIAAVSYDGLIELAPGDLTHALTFTSNYHEARSWWLNHTWSLSVEEQFYLVWPFSVFFLKRRGAIWFAIAVVCLAPIARGVMWYGLSSTATAMTRELPATADALAAGALLALCQPKWLSRIASPKMGIFWLFLAFVVPAAIFAKSPGVFYVVGQSLMVSTIALCISSCVSFPSLGLGRIANHRFLVWHGLASYSLYLWQEPFLNSFEVRWVTTFPQNIALSYVAAIFSLHLVEKPARKWISSWLERAH